MAAIRPFPALRPRPDRAAQVSAPPYDVMSEAEARQIAAHNPLSFLHVSRPEVGLPPGTDPHAPAAYAQARRAFDALQADGSLYRETQPAFYLYRQSLGPHQQTGLVAAAACAEYLDGTIRKHELTRPDKELDRVRHIEALDAQTGPAFLFHRARPALTRFIREHTAAPPDVDFIAPDGVRHTTWTVGDPRDLAFLESEFAQVPRLYIADGHHRSAAATRVFQARQDDPRCGGFLSVIFPHDALQILPYHRVVQDLHHHSPRQLLERLARLGHPEPDGSGSPPAPGTFDLFLEDRWHRWRFPASLTGAAATPLSDRLDVALLQQHVLRPLLGIEDPRTDQRLGFVGGSRGPAELERLVRSGEFAAAFALHPTRIESLMEIADAGGLMPPKSTWFEPKLRDALFSLLLPSRRGPCASLAMGSNIDI